MARRKEVIGLFTLALIFALSLPGAATELQGSQTAVARLEVGPARLDWLPQADYEQWVLTVAGPGDLYIRREFKSDKAPFLSLFDSKGERLPDGSYNWELRGIPKPGALLREELLKSGHFFVREGSFVAAPVDTAARPPKTPHPSITPKNFVETGTLVVQNNACIGNQCSTTDATFSALKLKSTQPNILFDDVDVPCEAPPCVSTAHDWALLINPSDVAQFSIRDVDGNLTPFTVAAGAPDNSLYVRSNGNVGLGTSTPASQLHVFGNDAGFRNKILVENANTGAAAPRELLEIRNKGAAVFILDDTTVAERWGVGTLGSSLVFDNQALAGLEMFLGNTGNLTIAGTLTQGSDRDSKRDIVPVQPSEVLAKVATLPITTWNRKTDDSSVRHMGPMAQDFASTFRLGEDDKHIAILDVAGVSLASIQALYSMVTHLETAKDAEIAALRRENADLASRVATLEALVAKAIPEPVP